MKHNLKITIIILSMFIITQFIGLFIVNYYSPVKIIDAQVTNISAPDLPYGVEPPEIKEPREFNQVLISIIIAFIIAISLIFLLSKFNAVFFLKLWFFIVVAIALGIALNAIIPSIFPSLGYSVLISTLVSVPLAFIKIYRPNFYVHNLTELFIYPGIATVFVPLLNLWTLVLLLILISIYDMWAVWHSGIMQKMAKFQMDKLNIFSGFLIPSMDKKTRNQIRLIRQRIKQAKTKKSKEKIKGNKIKINFAILGGGDVIFPLIAAGVLLKTVGFKTLSIGLLPIASLFVIIGATLGLISLLLLSEKKKFYPAMPFITLGIFAGLLAYNLLF